MKRISIQQGMRAIVLSFFLSLGACSESTSPRCGPTEAVVVEVLDGDTVVLADGTRIRYLLIDSPEISNGKNECFGLEARDINRDLVLNKTVQLEYDEECYDTFDRLLAYISVNGRNINSLMVERGYACALYIPPNGEDQKGYYEALETAARAANRGMWGACEEPGCS